MIGFLETYGTPAISIDAITSIGRSFPVEGRHGKVDHRRVHYRHGKEASHFDFHAADIDNLLKRPVQLMPAEHGVKLLYLGTHDVAPWVSRSPLIAWALCLDGLIRPVTPAGVDDDTSEPDQGWWTEMPDGTIHATAGVFDVTRFDDEAALLEWAKTFCKPLVEQPA